MILSKKGRPLLGGLSFKIEQGISIATYPPLPPEIMLLSYLVPVCAV